MALVPVKLRPDRKARGWKPPGGWYLFDTCKLTAVSLHESYRTKTEAWRAAAQRMGLTVPQAKDFARHAPPCSLPRGAVVRGGGA